jgi:hypothetical protein
MSIAAPWRESHNGVVFADSEILAEYRALRRSYPVSMSSTKSEFPELRSSGDKPTQHMTRIVCTLVAR